MFELLNPSALPGRHVEPSALIYIMHQKDFHQCHIYEIIHTSYNLIYLSHREDFSIIKLCNQKRDGASPLNLKVSNSPQQQ